MLSCIYKKLQYYVFISLIICRFCKALNVSILNTDTEERALMKLIKL